MNARHWHVAAVVAALVAVAVGLGAYSLTGRRWPSGTGILMQLQLGSSGGTLKDGSSTWDVSAEDALALWNQVTPSVSFRVNRNSTVAIRSGNGLNNVLWADTVYGDDFGDAIATTLMLSRGGVISETDVLFNRKYDWNSYTGNLVLSSGSGWLYDLHRTALHEFGHVLGLDHPDQHGQSVTTIMSSRTNDIYQLQSDDIAGVRAIYGSDAPANRAPTVTASCSPCTVASGRSVSLTAVASDADRDTLSYQWTAVSGTLGSATAASTTWLAPFVTGPAVITTSVADGRGGTASASVTVQVTAADRLLAGAALRGGQSITSPSGRYQLAFQSDGNLVLYDLSNRQALWWTGTAGSGGQAVLQTDGNFVVYDSQSSPLWFTRTSGNANAFLAVQDDGNVVLYSAAGQPLWHRFM